MEEPMEEEMTEEPTEEPMAEEMGTIVDIAVADGRFTTLVTAVQAAGLAETLSGAGPFTVFAPTDEAFAAISHREAESQPSPDRHWFYLGAGLALWGGWQLSTAVGVLLGARLPADWPLDFALPLTFIAIVVPLIRSRAMLLAAGVAGGVALLAAGLPFKLGLLAAALAGMAAGWWAADKAR